MTMELQKFDKLKAEMQVAIAPVLDVKVIDRETSLSAVKSGALIKTWQKQLEDMRDSLVRPLNQRVKEINAYAKSVGEPLVAAETHLKGELRTWEIKLQEERRRLELEAEAERKRIEAKTKAEAEEKRKEAELLAAFGTGEEEAAIAKAEADVIEERGAVEAEAHQRATVTQISEKKVEGATRFWNFEITDANAVPREFLIVDEKAIRKAMLAGAREIAGVRIFQDTRVAFSR